jgi:hypothetical protein
VQHSLKATLNTLDVYLFDDAQCNADLPTLEQGVRIESGQI